MFLILMDCIRARFDFQKTCPGCDAMTYKAGGCNHMTCPVCNTHWCWICRWKASNSDEIYSHLTQTHGGSFDFQMHGDYSDDEY